ncbi:MAG TPA: type II secretion system protein N [Paucimonas sp.]|nr:type II secretion system protein N [Paucimonas sp.]HJW54007.1 type II secretion system protein N [Burkholderiaceae bacterium]
MKRQPLVASFVLFIVLCISAAYWAMQLFKPPVRAVAAPPPVARAEVKLDAAAALFGGHSATAAVASNYQLKGVVVAGNGKESIAILAANGKPAQAIGINGIVAPGVTVKEVHPGYVLVSEDGVTKRVELPESAKNLTATAGTVGNNAAPVATAPIPPRTAPPVTGIVNAPAPVPAFPARPAPVPAPVPVPVPVPVIPASPSAQTPVTSSGATTTATPQPVQSVPGVGNPVNPNMPGGLNAPGNSAMPGDGHPGVQ